MTRFLLKPDSPAAAEGRQVHTLAESNIQIKNRDANEAHEYSTGAATWELESSPWRSSGFPDFPSDVQALTNQL